MVQLTPEGCNEKRKTETWQIPSLIHGDIESLGK